MKQTEVSSLGFKLKLNVPETVEEFDQAAGKAGAALEFAVAHEVAHGTLGEFRTKFCEALAAESGIARPFHVVKATKAGGKDKEIWGREDGTIRTEDEYFKFVLANTGKKPEDYRTLAESVIDGIVFDPKQKERSSAGPTIAKMYYTAADSVLASPSGGDKGARAIIAKLTGTAPLDSDDAATIRTKLATAIRDDMQKKDISKAYLKLAA